MHSAEVVVLGSGTSNGVPMLGRRYPESFLANPKNHRTRPSIIFLGPTGNLLVDCAPELRIQMTREGIYDIDSVVITHTHADHVMGMDDLRSISIRTGLDMPVYALPKHQEDIRRIFAYAFQDFPPGIDVPRFDLREPPQRLDVGGLECEMFQVWHGPEPVLGLRCRNLAYVTDVSDIPQAVMDRLGGLEILILDAVRYEPHPNHFHFDRAIEVAQEIGAKSTYFTHLSHDYDHDLTNSTLPQGIQLAYDGLRLHL